MELIKQANLEINDMEWECLESNTGRIMLGRDPKNKERLPRNYEEGFLGEANPANLEMINDKKFICTAHQIKQLFSFVSCKLCHNDVGLTHQSFCGSVLELTFACSEGHKCHGIHLQI